MLVKKFEAPSIKEALVLVKNQLGPDAIILSARENTSSFGLGGKSSVEVTAAVSETQLKKRNFAESRLRENEKDQLRRSTARQQKDFIGKSVDRYSSQPAAPVGPPKARRYIDIADEEGSAVAPQQLVTRPSLGRASFVEGAEDAAKKRVKEAAKSALSAAKATFDESRERTSVERRSPSTRGMVKSESNVSNPEVLSLRSEVEQLRQLLESFKRSPMSPASLHPGASFGLPYEMSFLFQRLTESGVTDALAAEVCQAGLKELTLDQLKKKALVDAWAAKHMMQDIRLTSDPWAPGLHLFVGPSGQGKTSALVKMASHMVLREHKRVAILTTDTSKVGATDQLRIYAQILNVPFGVLRNRQDWSPVLQTLAGFDSILVDFPSSSLRSLQEIETVQGLLPPQEARRTTHLVLSVNQKDADALEIARRYKLTHFQDLILSKLDESVNHGMIYMLQRELNMPLHSLGIGPLIPEDFELATKERIIDLIFKLSKIRGN